MLAGKQLLLEELSSDLRRELSDLKKKGEVVCVQGITKKASKYICQRCGNIEQRLFASFLCKRCGKACAYCRKCITMGRVSECTVLVRGIHERNGDRELNPLQWNGTLSIGQELAAQGVTEAIKQKKSFFIWAVCGAGKTEMLFYGIEEALRKGERVCIATPRTDVVLELAPRLQEVFPSITVAALYGGSVDHKKDAALVVATTHQLLRYYRAFHVMIVDEIDAFPYHADQMLQYAVRQAMKEKAARIYLTATPDEKWKRNFRKGKQKGVIVSGRYHRHPLPVPLFSWCGNWKKSLHHKKIPRVLLQWLKMNLNKKYPIFLFVPHVRYIEEISQLLKGLDNRIDGVHAEDSMRKEKVASFRKGDIPLLVTTTILERGVTVKNLQVAVLGAEEEIFSESALVQIAGRAGRSFEEPYGEVMYFHYGKTEAMVRAKKHIQSMNKNAKEQGLID
ncbi:MULTISPECIES: ATP-dependent helicase ComFA [Bacillus cereus group]|uniref:ATP-dependent helicase ComFA n=1 Tax=Bacillus cereus group TaxID=86661 RepID=UPI0009455282|nr:MULTISPECIES: DEAD/DEAH box helicase [Bacillus cereus group]PEB04746.1 DNA/RNA helicase [Bacillus cereus]MCZ7521981.1 DEAD/DEAH box helicase [Bacillus pacificus]MDA1573832.1 DEAD/DEAH box helicase [Bacillus cereus group sp. TH242-3LC]MED1586588.1 DEAD/DEAH box helicase [Bacillus pacificus]RRB01372.1 DEAD/DEAH box helicase [Bacillus pacificus]